MALGLAGAWWFQFAAYRSPLSPAGLHLVKQLLQALYQRKAPLHYHGVCHIASPVFSTNCQHCEWTGEIALQARMKTTGKADIVSEGCSACICLVVMISPVLCLLNILHFILSLSGGNLFMNRWLHCKTSMIAELLK